MAQNHVLSYVSCWVGRSKNLIGSCESSCNGDAQVLPEKINKNLTPKSHGFIDVNRTVHTISPLKLWGKEPKIAPKFLVDRDLLRFSSTSWPQWDSMCLWQGCNAQRRTIPCSRHGLQLRRSYYCRQHTPNASVALTLEPRERNKIQAKIIWEQT